MTRTSRRQATLCAAVLVTSFSLAYVAFSAATQFGNDNNCGPVTNGTNGSDVYYMGGGNDCASMFGGGDVVDGQGGGDQASGGLRGDDGGDWVFGGAGCDTMSGGQANDYEDGQDDCDAIIDGQGLDIFRGGAGGDNITAADQAGGDDVQGGSGDDFCSWNDGDTVDGCEHRVTG